MNSYVPSSSATRTVVRGPYKAIKAVFLVGTGCADQTGFLTPDSDHCSYCPVIVDNGGTIEWVPAYCVFCFLVFTYKTNYRVFFRCTLTDDWRFFACLPHQIISNYINTKLGITKSVFTSFNSDQSSP